MLPYKHHVAVWVLIFLVLAGTTAFHLRAKWLPRLRAWRARNRLRLDGYSGLPSFDADVEAGLSSQNFDVAHINANDSRKGLDDKAKKRILDLMTEKNISFDEARLQYTQMILADNQIGPDGMPLDPRTVTFGK